MKKALVYGILASAFFSFTFILNRSMAIAGGSWLWSSALRYLFMLPLLRLLLIKWGGTGAVYQSIRKNPLPWFLWSSIGFGVFYVPITLASVYGASWFIAATWQVTIVAGVLLTPLWREKIPFKNLLWGLVILWGIFMLQIPEGASTSTQKNGLALGLILVAAFAYPLGNRMMMNLVKNELNTVQRVYGMTVCTLPIWLALSIIATKTSGLPSPEQVIQSILVALFSGVIATLLFFRGTELVKHNPKQLAVIEATQCGEVVFTLIGGLLFLKDTPPNGVGMVGILLIILGMTINSLVTKSDTA